MDNGYCTDRFGCQRMRQLKRLCDGKEVRIPHCALRTRPENGARRRKIKEVIEVPQPGRVLAGWQS